MQIDRQNGRELELEAIIGRPLALAAKHGVAAPRIAALHQLLSIINNVSQRNDL
jgi:2-dehydropantoate 2-reductase